MKRSAAVIAAVTSLAGPGAAGAATLGTAQDGRLVYRAAVGELNDVTAREDFDGTHPWPRTLVFTEAVAAVAVGAGCVDSDPIACELRDTDIHLGNRDDRGGLRVDAFRTSRVWGDSGDDVVSSSGGEAYGFGGAGDDTVSVGAHGSAIGNGGGGDDTLGAGSVGFAVLNGDAGADVLTAGAPRVTLDGGPGPDTIDGTVQGFGSGLMLGGAGADQLTSSASDAGWRIDGGGGRDEIDAGSSGADTIACGAGRDTVRAGTDDVVAADCETVVLAG
jgi:RTX calcium-binding nonapeptide repeat (4 copies)